MKIHIFGAKPSPACANFGLKQLAKDNSFVSQSASVFLQRDFYVNDGLQANQNGADNVEALKKAREICSRGNLRLHKITSNSKDFLDYFPESEITSASKSIDLSAPVVEKTLGLKWHVDTDTLGFTSALKHHSITRKGVLSTIASLYDPLGFLAPFILEGKLILQEMCKD
ncbi:Non-LTR (Long terminal repeat) retrotransposon and domain-containing protein [Elysia marginata]|uniref:Non-LTR (Long terminal repeat) retrotransposon and domain-containing protein n=1 Tax=Elysia marginata TaxID=1093978 RepID=A0AAV4H7E1_9GAST|nr:Non-LTR (Long terminal repeat) retrotransposon and domain-containing protein [Elysia marginata]